MVFILLFSLIAVFTIFFFNKRNYWDKNNSLFLVVRRPDNSVLVSVFDPVSNEISNIVIPKNTEVEVSSELGVWKIGTVWELGEQHGLDGLLLANTVRKNFNFPTASWADYYATGFSESKISSLFKALFFSYKTNLSFGDRLAITILSLRVKNGSKVNIDLTKTNLLKSKLLLDGTEGYVLTGNFPQFLSSLVVDRELGKGSYKLFIKYKGSSKIAERIGSFLEVLGTKVVSIDYDEKIVEDCRISGLKSQLLLRISKILSCPSLERGSGDSYSIDLSLGNIYMEKF